MQTTVPVLIVTTFGSEFLPKAFAKVDKFNARAKRAGIESRFEVAYSSTEVQQDATVLGLPTEVVTVTTFAVLGEPLKVEGWEFVATLSFDSEAGVVTRPVPGAVEVDLSQYRSLEVPVCDACGTRRQRKDVYVLLDTATGETKVVGRNCLAAFIGLDVTGALAYIDDVSKVGDEGTWGGFGFGEARIPTTTVLALTSAAIAEFGWIAKSAYTGVPTAARVLQVVFPASIGKEAIEADREVAAKLSARLETEGGVTVAQKRADEVLEWVRSTHDLQGEYGTNLQAILSADSVSTRNLGLACSAVIAWSKAVERKIEKAARHEAAAASEFVGQVGDKLTGLSLTVAQPPRFFDGEYGTSTLLIFTGADGNTYKWFASGSRDASVGDVFTGTGTIKKHEQYNDLKSTVLTRCRLA